MRYMGGKFLIAKHLLAIMLPYRKPEQWWVEPFVGGANVIDKVEGARIGNDINAPLIALFKALQNGYVPPYDISEELYNEIKSNQDKYPLELVAFVAFNCSFGAKWFKGFARGKERNYAEVGSRVLQKQARYFKDVIFKTGSYDELEIPPASLIYCDPPYSGTEGYMVKFDHEKFWQWCRNKTDEGHTVFVSEYSAPSDFECLVEISQANTMNAKLHKASIERLFRYKS